MADWRFATEPYCFVPSTSTPVGPASQPGPKADEIAKAVTATTTDGFEVAAVKTNDGKIGGNITSQPQGQNGYELGLDGKVKVLGQPPANLKAPTAQALRANLTHLISSCPVKGPGV